MVKCRVVNYFNANTSFKYLGDLWDNISYAYWKIKLLYVINLQIFFFAESFFANLVQLLHHLNRVAYFTILNLFLVDSKFCFIKKTLR